MDRYFPGRFAVTVRPWDFGRRQRVRLLDDSVSVVLAELMTLARTFPSASSRRRCPCNRAEPASVFGSLFLAACWKTRRLARL